MRCSLLSCNIVDRLERLQNVMQQDHEDIKEVAREGFAAIQQDIKEIKNLVKGN